MIIADRIALMVRLGEYMLGNDEAWKRAKAKAFAQNNWFIPEFIQLSLANIVHNFLKPGALTALCEKYAMPQQQQNPKRVGLVLAGNIPLVGFHDVLCCFLSGHHAMIKTSSKDDVLLPHLVQKIIEWNPDASPYLQISPLLKNCDAYIATGGDNTARYFEYYFRAHPSIIRKNRTSIAVLTGEETKEELDKLADDVHQYFGLGCRNVTKLFVPNGYDFVPLLQASRKYNYFINHNKYKNNYDYNLAIHLLNHNYYMTNDSLLVIENETPFSPISQLHYSFYDSMEEVTKGLKENEAVQCVVGNGFTPFGQAQCPQLSDFADGVDTMGFLKSLGAVKKDA